MSVIEKPKTATAALTEAGEGTDTSEGAAASRSEALPRLGRGDAIGRYVILDAVGRGGMSMVYAAYDPQLDRRVAIKVLLPGRHSVDGDDPRRARLLREAQAIAAVDHRNVIAVHDVGVEAGRVFMAMEFVAGRDLRAWLRERRAVSDILDVFVQAGEGLAAAHRAGLVHRDFKPDNVLLGDDGRVRVCDFGLVRRDDSPDSETRSGPAERHERSDSRLTVDGALLGTPAYMAPEQMRGDAADAKSDQFAFCVALFEALYGQRPFAGDDVPQIVAAVARGRIRIPDDTRGVPSSVYRAIRRGLHGSPHERHPDLDALLEELRRDPKARRRRGWVIGGALVGAIGLTALAYRQASDAADATCSGAQARRATLWSAERQDAMRSAFVAAGDDAEQAWRGVQTRIDNYLDDWQAMHEDACAATRIRGERSEQLLDLQMVCLDARIKRVEALAFAFEQATPSIVLGAVEAVAGLPAVAPCGDLETIRDRVYVPDDPSLRDEVEAIRGELRRAEAVAMGGDAAAAHEIRLRARARAGRIDFLPLAAEIEHALLQNVPASQSLDETLRATERAFESALAARNDELAIRVAIGAAFVLGEARHQIEQGDTWARRAEALLTRIGGDRELQMQLWNARGVIASRSHRPKEASEYYERLMASLDTHDIDPVKAANYYNNYGAVHAEHGQIALAQSYMKRAHAIRLQELGSTHPLTIIVAANLGILAYKTGKFDEAVQWLEPMRAMLEDPHPPAHLGNSLVALSRAYYRLDEDALAAEVAHDVLRLQERRFGKRSIAYGEALQALAHAQRGLGDFEAGRRSLEEALAIYDANVDAVFAGLFLRSWMIEQRASDGEVEAARVDARAALARALAEHAEPCVIRTYAQLVGDLELDLGDRVAARAAFERARDIHFLNHHACVIAGVRTQFGLIRLGDHGPPGSPEHDAALRQLEAEVAAFDEPLENVSRRIARYRVAPEIPVTSRLDPSNDGSAR